MKGQPGMECKYIRVWSVRSAKWVECKICQELECKVCQGWSVMSGWGGV